MAGLRTLMIVLGALAVLAVGGLSVAGPAAAASPCHSTEHGGPTGHEAPDTPDRAMTPMACCVMCVAAVAPRPPVRADITLPAPPRVMRRTPLPAGEHPGPEPHPPRLTNV